MSDVTDTTPQTEPEAAEVSEEDTVAAAIAADEGNDTPAEDEDEIEYKGTKHRVPKPVKEAYAELQKASTHKMMEAAAERKRVEADRASFAETQKTFQVVIEEVSELRGIDKQLAAYQEMTPAKWLQLHRENPDAAAEHQLNYTALMTQRGQIAGSLNEKIQKAQESDRVSRETSSAEAKKAVASAIKDWSPEREQSLKDAAVSHYKASPQHLAYIGTDAVATSILNDAIKYRNALAKAKATVKTASDDAVIPPAPVKKVGGTATATRNPENMTGDEFMKFELARLARIKPKSRMM